MADVYIVGSDQVWNPKAITAVHFLEFAPIGKKCISYAASMGNANLNNDIGRKREQYLKKFSAISVREESAKKEIGKLYK